MPASWNVIVSTYNEPHKPFPSFHSTFQSKNKTKIRGKNKRIVGICSERERESSHTEDADSFEKYVENDLNNNRVTEKKNKKNLTLSVS